MDMFATSRDLGPYIPPGAYFTEALHVQFSSFLSV